MTTTAPAKKGLGKGLSALMGEGYSQSMEPRADRGSPTGVALEKIHASRYQPRLSFNEQALAELAESIRVHGVMQPILVRPSTTHMGMYEIVAGERRFRAAKLAGLEIIPALIHTLNDEQALEFAIVENVQRHDLGPLEEALGYRRLIDDFDHTQETISKAVGKSRSHIANLLRLLELPKEVRDLIESGALTTGHARALIGVENAAVLAREVARRGLNVRQTEQLVKELAENPEAGQGRRPRAARGDRPKDADIAALEASLSESLGVGVSIRDRNGHGEITLSYDSLSQLDDILRRLGGETVAGGTTPRVRKL